MLSPPREPGATVPTPDLRTSVAAPVQSAVEGQARERAVTGKSVTVEFDDLILFVPVANANRPPRGGRPPESGRCDAGAAGRRMQGPTRAGARPGPDAAGSRSAQGGAAAGQSGHGRGR
jgi:hypothetical protein